MSISKDTLGFVDRAAAKSGHSRSHAIECMIEESRRRQREQDLAAMARAFFSQEPAPEEVKERDEWLKMSLETLKHDR